MIDIVFRNTADILRLLHDSTIPGFAGTSQWFDSGPLQK
jgi:hypothetical protein